MSDTTDTILDAIRCRSAKRRDVLKYAGQAGAVAGGLTLLSACGGDAFDHTIPPAPPFSSPTPAPTPPPTPAPVSTAKPGISDADIPTINFLLNLAYMHAAFFVAAGTAGATLAPEDVSGQGTLGTIVVPAPVGINTVDVNAFAQSFAQEVGRNSLARLQKIRSVMGSAAIAAPAMDLSQTTWSPLATAAGIGKVGATFNPTGGGPTFISASIYMNAVTLAAFKGALQLLTSRDALTLASGCVGGLGYDTALIRTMADMQSQITTSTPGINNAPIVNTRAFTAYMNKLVGTGTPDQSVYIGEAVSNGGANSALAANVNAADTNGLGIGRSPARTLNLVFNTGAAATSGGFFPSGFNSFAPTGITLDPSLTTSAGA